MFRKSTDTFVIAVLFVVGALLLEKFHFWHAIGLQEPKSFVIVGLMFLTLVIILQHTLFEPFLAITNHRIEQTTDKRKRADQQRLQADAILKSYEQKILNARLEAMRQRESIAIEAESQERILLDAAKQKSQANLDAAVAEIKIEVEKTKIELQATTGTLVAQLVDEVLSTKPTGTANETTTKSVESRM